MSKKKTHEEYVAELAIKNPMIKVVGEYAGAKTKIEHHCLIHDVYWYISPTNVLQGKGCNKCMVEKRSYAITKTHERYVYELRSLNKNIAVVGEYINAKTPILHRCSVDGYEWYVAPDKTLHGRGCPKCAGNIKKTHEEYVDELLLINPYVNAIEKYLSADDCIQHKCLICGNVWSARPNDILCGKGCPKCSKSHGEKQICKLLDDNNIKYISQKTFSDCVDERALPFDFYLPDYNACIEYQGVQHYKPIKYFGGEKAFEKLKKHDKIKEDYCNNNGIILLAISYTSNIKKELNDFLFI